MAAAAQFPKAPRPRAAWPAGVTLDPAPGVDQSTHASAVSEAVLLQLRKRPDAVLPILESLAQRAGDALLEAVLRTCWMAIRDALPPGPRRQPDRRHAIRRPSDNGVHGVLVYLVLALAPNPTSVMARALPPTLVEFLWRATAYDPSLVRHLLTWASVQRGNHAGAHGSSPASAQALVWADVAERLRSIHGLSRVPHWEEEDWATQDAVTTAKWLAQGIDPHALHGASLDYFESELALLIEVGRISPLAAEVLGDDPALTRELPPIEFRYSQDWQVEALPHMPLAVLGDVVASAGWQVAMALKQQNLPPTTGSVARVLQRDEDEVDRTSLCRAALLWADTEKLVSYQKGRRTYEATGVQVRLREYVDMWPDAWQVCARDLIAHRDTVGREVMQLLELAAAYHGQVRDALQNVVRSETDPTVRDATQGLLARVDGEVSPDEELLKLSSDRTARAVDGSPVFPHPLTPLARTWLGSTDVEALLTQSLRRAMARFGEWARDQGAAQEEALSGVLLRDLESALRDVDVRAQALGGRTRSGSISVRHRQVTKHEEKTWQCDLALLLNADIRPVVSLRLAELVQVKKSEAFAQPKSAVRHERWRIDIGQLMRLLAVSESSCYWLILSTGEVLCVTARWLNGLVTARAKPKLTVTIGYNDVRHTAVPMEQFLLELFVGTWIGSPSEDTLRFARGEDSNLTPRHIFEITISGNQSDL